MGQVISVELRKQEGARNDVGQVGRLGEVAHLRGQGHLTWRHAAGGTRRDPQIKPPTVHMENWPGRGVGLTVGSGYLSLGTLFSLEANEIKIWFGGPLGETFKAFFRCECACVRG